MVRRYLVHLLIILLAASFVLPPVSADEILLDHDQSLPFKYFFGNKAIQPGTELLLSGNNLSEKQQILILRLDNADSKNYRSRVNQEYSLPEGKFSLSIPLTGLKTSGGQPLSQPYSEMIIFSAGNNRSMTLDNVRIKTPKVLPDKTLALDFGHSNSPLFPGFRLLAKGDARIKGKLLPRMRTSGDALIQDGLEGIDSIAIPWPNGQWKLSLWAQDQGEWEYLPHFLSRKVTAEGSELINEVYSREQWINRVYLAGMSREASITGNPWQTIGLRRSGLISTTVTINDGVLNISLEGDRAARYLSALVIEPVSGQFASTVQQQRREKFLSQWPVTRPSYQPPEELTITDISQQVKDTQTSEYLAARGTLLNLEFEINSPEDDHDPVIAMAPPRSYDGHKLHIASRYGHWRYERPHPNASALVMDDSLLRSDISSLTLSGKLPRRIHIQVNIPVNAKPGNYQGSVQLFSNGALYLAEYQVRVLPATLPRLETPVGLYLEPAPYYQWFPAISRRQAFATACDLSLLATLGFTSLAPALATPADDASRQQFIHQLKQLRRFGFSGSVLAYAPLKRLLAGHDLQTAGMNLLKLKKALAGQDLPEVYWSVFDEPAPDRFASIQESSRLLHSAPLSFKTAGHLNNPDQQELASTADLQIINHGFGVTADSIVRMKQQGKVWLYNMPSPRLAAGAYLWRSGAEGYLQWHGRMPTADPFDPTDGREGDVIYLYPWQGSCPDTINIHRRLLDLHEATLDLRWLQWLEKQSQTSNQAKLLLQNIQMMIPADWLNAQSITPAQLADIRKRIMTLSPRE